MSGIKLYLVHRIFIKNFREENIPGIFCIRKQPAWIYPPCRLFCCYFIPLPFDAAGFRAVSDDMLPFLDAVRIIPFSYAVECMPYADYYFSPLLPLFCGAALLGFYEKSAIKIRVPLAKHFP